MYLPIYDSNDFTRTGSIETSAVRGFFVNYGYPTTLNGTGTTTVHASISNASPIIYVSSSHEAAMQVCDTLTTHLFGDNLLDHFPELLI